MPRFPVRGNVLGGTSDGTVYVLRNDARGTQIFFAQDEELESSELGRHLVASGYLYSSVPLPPTGWVDVPGDGPPVEKMRTWGKPPIRPHWYFVEPFYSD